MPFGRLPKLFQRLFDDKISKVNLEVLTWLQKGIVVPFAQKGKLSLLVPSLNRITND